MSSKQGCPSWLSQSDDALRPDLSCLRMTCQWAGQVVQPQFLLRLLRASRWKRRRCSEGGGTKPPCGLCRSRPNAAPSVRFQWRETVRTQLLFSTCFQETLPTLCFPLQVDVCTCTVPCVEQSGAGCVESRGTESVWVTIGLDDKHTHTLSVKSRIQAVTVPYLQPQKWCELDDFNDLK